MQSPFPVRLLVSAMLLAATQTPAAPPNAGQISTEPRLPVRPATTAGPALRVDKPTSNAVPEGGPTVRIKAVMLQRRTAFTSPGLQAALDEAVGRDMTFADLVRLADRVTREYRDAGYLVARAYLPVQQLKDGKLIIAVLEGRLEQVTWRNDAGLLPSALEPLQHLPLNSPVQARSLDPILLNLADLPGMQVQSTLRPGQTLSASELFVEFSRTRRLEGSADLDNYGSNYTGAQRLGASLSWNNPLDRGDQLSLRVQASNANLRYARLAYQLPVGAQATRIGLAASIMRYRLGKEFQALDANGSAHVASLYLRHGLLRSVSANWYGQLQYDDKSLRDAVDRIDIPTVSRQRLHNLVLGINGDWSDTWVGEASNALQANLTSGRLHLDDLSQGLDDQGPRSSGGFRKFEAQLLRVQSLRPGWSLALTARGQLADGNLGSVEKMSLGGSQGVRAYSQGEGLGDSGWQASAELRWNPAPGWLLQAFADAGGVKINQQPWPDLLRDGGSNQRRLSGAGLGAAWGTQGMALNLTAAWAVTGEPSTPAIHRRPQIWAQASVAY